MTHHVLIMEQSHEDLITSQIAVRKGKCISFIRIKHGVDKLTKRVNEVGVAVVALREGKAQAQRSRVLESFKSGVTNALVATDVSARGIYVDNVQFAVQVDAPENEKEFFHRAGRTTRASVRLNESTVRPMDANLVKVTGAAEPSGIPVISGQGGKNNDGGRSGGYRGAGSRVGGKKKKSRPRPHERLKLPSWLRSLVKYFYYGIDSKSD